jgi:MFS family permease
MMKDTSMNDASARKSVLLATTLNAFLFPFMGSSVTIALPSIADTFKMDAVLLSWVIISFGLTGTIFLVPFGKAADIYGRKKIFQYGNVLFTLSTFLVPFSMSGSMLIALRFLHGFGASMTYSTGFAILTQLPQLEGCFHPKLLILHKPN